MAKKKKKARQAEADANITREIIKEEKTISSNDIVNEVAVSEIKETAETRGVVGPYVEEEPIKEEKEICKHIFEPLPAQIHKKNAKGIPHIYKTFVCKKCGYSEEKKID